MKKKFKAAWTKVQNFFRNSFNRLLGGVLLLLLAIPIRAGWILQLCGAWPSVIISITWIVVSVFYFAMYIWAVVTR